METISLVVHVFLALGVIGLVLIQHGKGADAGAAFGSGASSTVFGSRGSGSFLTRMTTLFALAFFCTSMVLFFLASQRNATIGSVVDGVDVPVVDTPVVPQSDVPAAADVPSVSEGGASQEGTSGESDVPAVKE
ncbi:preprotein translocase subunit SecG [Chromatiales bacterium (ex Bugula neritina AB1)]|nr:preprotein translocase subunit SecG [Chromatiales bacterium (ex Bugula neritina AB1)]